MPKVQETPAAALKSLMDEYQISLSKLAELIKYNTQSIRNLIVGKASITPLSALRLAKLFGTKPEYWLDLQTKADIAKASADPELIESLKSINRAVKPAPTKTPPAANTTKGAKAGKAPAGKTNPAGKPVKTGKKPAKPETAGTKTTGKPKGKKA
jgi:addiction module HigA family antidote